MRTKDPQKLSQIYDATLHLVGQVGLAGISMAAIAKEAGIATGSLYTYYADKEQLINETFKETLKVYGRELFAGFSPTQPVKEAMRKLFDNYFLYLQQHHNERIFQDQYLISPYAVENADLKVFALDLLSPFSQVLQRGANEGLLKDVDMHYPFYMLMGFGHELALAVRMKAMEGDRTFMDTSFNMFWDAIRA